MHDLNALRHFRSLSGYHYRMVVLTILLPAIGPTSLALFGPDHFIMRVILYVVAFLIWSVLAVLAVASMLKRDKSEAERLTSQSSKRFRPRLADLREELEDSRVGLRQQVKDLEEVVRSTLREELGGRSSTSADLSRGQGHWRKLNNVCQCECSRGEQAGAPSTVVPTHDTGHMGSGVRKAG